MIDINNFTKLYVKQTKQIFGDRVWFIGLQGSYARGEATDKSDIDIVLILDILCPNDLKVYKKMLDTMPHRDLICGFVSGKDELLNWTPNELFQFYYDTVSLTGNLDILLEKIDSKSVLNAIQSGACAIYHACVHNYLHEKSTSILHSLYKSATFVIRAINFYNTGTYIKSLPALSSSVEKPDKIILQAVSKFEYKNDNDFEIMSKTLFVWAQNTINKYSH